MILLFYLFVVVIINFILFYLLFIIMLFIYFLNTIKRRLIPKSSASTQDFLIPWSKAGQTARPTTPKAVNGRESIRTFKEMSVCLSVCLIKPCTAGGNKNYSRHYESQSLDVQEIDEEGKHTQTGLRHSRRLSCIQHSRTFPQEIPSQCVKEPPARPRSPEHHSQ